MSVRNVPEQAMADGLNGLPPRRATLWFGCLAMLVSYLPFSAVNAALGPISRSTGARTGQLQWVSDAFAVALAAAVLSGGVLADTYGRRRVALLGLLGTAVGAAVGFTAGAAGSAALVLLWIGQGISGVGAGLVMSSTLALIAAAAPDAAARGRAIAWWAVALVLGLGVGPFLASAAIAVSGWPLLYPPILAAAIVISAFGALRSGTSSVPGGRRLDVAGQATGALAIAAITFAIIQAGSQSWTAPVALVAGAIGVVALAAFVLLEWRFPGPLLDVRLFASRGFVGAGVAACAVLFAIGGGGFLLSLVLSRQHLGGLAIALHLACLFAGNAVASIAAGRLQAVVGPRLVILSGLLLAAIGSGTLWSVSADTGLGGYAWRLALLGAGCGAVMATTSAVAVASVATELTGMAGAGNNALRQIGAALGPAVLGSLLVPAAGGGQAVGPLHLGANVLVALFLVTAAVAAVLLPHRPRHTP